MEGFIRQIVQSNGSRQLAIHWSITLKKSGEPIGVIGYRNLEGDEADRGFWLAKPHHGSGLMSEAVIATQDYMFFEYGIDRIIVRNVISNAASRRVKQKTAARLLRVDTDQGDHHLKEDVEIWEVSKSGWKSFREEDGY